MPFDGIVTAAIARELDSKLAGGKIEKIYQPESDEILIHIHAGRSAFKLLISSNSSHARIYLTNAPKANPQNPAAFCMLMRKHLQNGRILSVSQKDTERIIEITIDTINEMGFSVNKKLIVEIMGKHSNIILIDNSTGRIIDSIKRVSLDVNRYRQTLPGLQYVYPPDQGKSSLFMLTPELFASFFKSVDQDLASSVKGSFSASGMDKEYAARMLVSSIQGISPALSRDLADRADSISQLFDILEKYAFKIRSNEFEPCVYLNAGGEPADFHCFPLQQAGSCFRELRFDDISAAAEYFYDHKASSNRIRQRSLDLLRVLESGINKLLLKKQKLSEDLLQAENAEIYKLYGELLTANMYRIGAKQSVVTVQNYYDGSDLSIPLDPRLSPSQNAQKYFRKYTKAKTAIKEKNIQLEETNSDIDYLESVLLHLENSDVFEDIEEIRNELTDGGFLRRKKATGKASKSRFNPLCRLSTDGFRILIGRNNRENDHLTFKTASGRDIWLHTKDIPGSHVVIITEGRQVTETTLFEAAAAAAYYSKGRMSENVPVDYTLIRHVKKPAGAKPGMVIFVNNKTLYVSPSDLQHCI